MQCSISEIIVELCEMELLVKMTKRKGQNKTTQTHPKSPPRKDFDELSFFSASSTKALAFDSFSDAISTSDDDQGC